MSQTPVTVTYSLEEVLGKIDNKLDNLQKDFNDKLDNLQKDFNDKLDKTQKDINDKLDTIEDDVNSLQKDVNDLKVGQARLEEKVEGLGRQVQNQEFINRGILVALVIAILGGAAKLFGFVGNP